MDSKGTYTVTLLHFFPDLAFTVLGWLRPGGAGGEQNRPFTSDMSPEFWLAPVF